MKLNKYLKIVLLAGILFLFAQSLLSNALVTMGGPAFLYGPMKFHTFASCSLPNDVSTCWPSETNYLNLFLDIIYWIAISSLTFYLIKGISKRSFRILTLLILSAIYLIVTVLVFSRIY